MLYFLGHGCCYPCQSMHFELDMLHIILGFECKGIYYQCYSGCFIIVAKFVGQNRTTYKIQILVADWKFDLILGIE